MIFADRFLDQTIGTFFHLSLVRVRVLRRPMDHRRYLFSVGPKVSGVHLDSCQGFLHQLNVIGGIVNLILETKINDSRSPFPMLPHGSPCISSSLPEAVLHLMHQGINVVLGHLLLVNASGGSINPA